MKRVIALVCGVLAVLLLAAPAAAKRDMDKVSGDVQYFDQNIFMNAQNTDFGVRGLFRYSNGSGLMIEGRVVALEVSGVEAVGCGTITVSNSPSIPVGSGFAQYVNDTGGKTQFDNSRTALGPADPCPSVASLSGTGLLNTGGQWHVHDAP